MAGAWFAQKHTSWNPADAQELARIRQEARVTFSLRAARPAHTGILWSAVIVHAISPSPADNSSFRLAVTRTALPGQSPPNKPPEQFKYQQRGREKRVFLHKQLSPWDSHSMLPCQSFWPKASLVLFARQKQESHAHTHSSGQPAGLTILVHSSQHATAPLQAATHHFPYPQVLWIAMFPSPPNCPLLTSLLAEDRDNCFLPPRG